MAISLISFGYRYGIPKADIVISARKLPNPWYVFKNSHKTGLDDDVYDMVRGHYQFKIFVNKAFDHTMSKHDRDSTLTVAIGCMGGKHRSVSVVRKLRRMYKNRGIKVSVLHRDIDRK